MAASFDQQPGEVIYIDESGTKVRIVEFKNFDWTNPFGKFSGYAATDQFPNAIGTYVEYESIATVYDFSDMDSPVNRIAFDFQYAPGVINVAVNGAEVNLFNGLEPGLYALAPGVQLEVTWHGPTPYVGKAIITGPVKSLFLGGTLLAIDNFCLNQEQVCQVFDMEVSTSPCDENGEFYVIIDAAYEGINEQSLFSLWLNGNETGEEYAYNELPIELGPYRVFENELIYEIRDIAHPDCRTEAVLAPKDCTLSCEIGPLQITANDCQENGTYTLDLNFEHTIELVSFDLFINEIRYNQYLYEDLPLEIGPFDEPGGTIMTFEVLDGSENCYQFAQLETPNCNTDVCSIAALEASTSGCDNEGYFMIDLSFSAQNTNPGGYYVFVDGNLNGPFDYEQTNQQIGPFQGDDGTIYDILVMDALDPRCFNYLEIGPINCSSNCSIRDFTVDVGSCTDDGNYALTLNFFVDGATNESFDLYRRDGERVGFYSLDDLPLTMTDFQPSEFDYDYLKVCINDNPDCCAEVEFMAPNCAGDCAIRIEVIEPYCIGDGLFLADLEVRNAGASEEDTFKIVSSDGEELGTFNYRDPYITIGPFIGDGQTNYPLVITDAQTKIVF